MTLTRANVESELVSRQEARMEVVEMAVTVDGSNADLNNPIGFAVRKSGGTVASFASVADGDLGGFEEADYDKLLDIAEYRLLLNIKGRWGKYDIRAGQLDEKLSQFGKDLDADIDRKLTELQTLYSFGVVSLEAGVVDYDFIQTDEDDDE
jgi:hypothetical protein